MNIWGLPINLPHWGTFREKNLGAHCSTMEARGFSSIFNNNDEVLMVNDS